MLAPSSRRPRHDRPRGDPQRPLAPAAHRAHHRPRPPGCRPRSCPTAPIAERIGVDDDWIVSRTGIQSRRRAPPTSALADLAGSPAAARSATPASTRRRRPRARGDDDARRAHAEHRRRSSPTRSASGAGALDIGAACTGWLAALSAGRRPDRDRPRRARARDRRRDPDAGSPTSTTEATAALFGDGAGAVVLGAEGDGEIGPIVLAADGGMADTITADHDERLHPHGRPLDVQQGRQGASARSTVAAVERAGLDARRHRPLRLPPGQRPHPPRRRRAARPRARARRRLRRRTGQHVGRLDPAHARRCCARTAACAPARRCCSPPSAPASPGAPASSSGGALDEPPRERRRSVTGASKGIGAAIAKALAADGWPSRSTTAPTRRAPRRPSPRSRRPAAGRRRLHGDVANGAPDELFKQAEEALGPVLALVNNAGVRADGLAIQIDDEAWDTVLDTNLTAAFRLTRARLRPMIKARYGRIVNVASVVGPRANAGQANYAAAKAGLIGMTKTVAARGRAARRDRQRGRARLHRDRHDQGPARRRRRGDPRPPRGQPEEVAAAVRFLASDDAGLRHRHDPVRRRRHVRLTHRQPKEKPHGHHRHPRGRREDRLRGAPAVRRR